MHDVENDAATAAADVFAADRIATEAFALRGTGRQVAPLSSRYPKFGRAESYDVAMQVCDLRRARREIPYRAKKSRAVRSTHYNGSH